MYIIAIRYHSDDVTIHIKISFRLLLWRRIIMTSHYCDVINSIGLVECLVVSNVSRAYSKKWIKRSLLQGTDKWERSSVWKPATYYGNYAKADSCAMR